MEFKLELKLEKRHIDVLRKLASDPHRNFAVTETGASYETMEDLLDFFLVNGTRESAWFHHITDHGLEIVKGLPELSLPEILEIRRSYSELRDFPLTISDLEEYAKHPRSDDEHHLVSLLRVMARELLVYRERSGDGDEGCLGAEL